MRLAVGIALSIAAFGLASLATGTTGVAHADTYHRFWRGKKLANLTPAEFEAGLNSVFVPATIQTGAGRGMIAYEPVLTEGVTQGIVQGSPGLPSGFPDEIALVSYEDLDAYNSLYATSPGKAYQALHWKYFDKTASQSLVPGAYSGTLAIEQTYDLHPAYSDWMKNRTRVLVGQRGPGETDADFLARIKAGLDAALSQDGAAGVLDRVILVAQDYWIEYVSAETGAGAGPESAAGSGSRNIGVSTELVFGLENVTGAQAQDGAGLSQGRGINLQF